MFKEFTEPLWPSSSGESLKTIVNLDKVAMISVLRSATADNTRATLVISDATLDYKAAHRSFAADVDELTREVLAAGWVQATSLKGDRLLLNPRNVVAIESAADTTRIFLGDVREGRVVEVNDSYADIASRLVVPTN